MTSRSERRQAANRQHKEDHPGVRCKYKNAGDRKDRRCERYTLRPTGYCLTHERMVAKEKGLE